VDGTKADDIALALEEAIVSGEIPPGSVLRQEHLSEQFDVSRTPVREALRRLAAEGLVEMRTNHGARVAGLEPDDIRMPYEARLVVEPGAARLAAKRSAADAQARMRAAIAAQRRAIPDVEATFDANRDFHLALVEASGNPFLLQIAEQLWLRRVGAPIYEYQAETPERMRADADEHEQILDAIEARDARGAESLTRRHVADAMKRSVTD
jgi:DNA-binding GntR family transcriptional regulator